MIFSLLVYAWVTKGEPPDKDRNDDNDDDENNKACPFFLKIYIHNQKTRHKKVGKWAAAFLTTAHVSSYLASCLGAHYCSRNIFITLFQVYNGWFHMCFNLLDHFSLLLNHHLHIQKQLVQFLNDDYQSAA